MLLYLFINFKLTPCGTDTSISTCISSIPRNLFPPLISTVLTPFIFFQLTALVFVPIFYGLQTWLVYHFSKNGWLAFGYFLLLIPTGLFAWYWKEELKVFSMEVILVYVNEGKPCRIPELFSDIFKDFLCDRNNVR